jgi:hypothetical protein
MIVTLVPGLEADLQWRLVLKFLGPAIATSGGRWKPEDVLMEVRLGQAQLWVAMEADTLYGAAITYLRVYPGMKAVFIGWLGGAEADRWLDLFDEAIQRWGVENGCRRLELAGRKGWERMAARYGARLQQVVMEKEIDYGRFREDARPDQADDRNPVAGLVAGPVQEPQPGGE